MVSPWLPSLMSTSMAKDLYRWKLKNFSNSWNLTCINLIPGVELQCVSNIPRIIPVHLSVQWWGSRSFAPDDWGSHLDWSRTTPWWPSPEGSYSHFNFFTLLHFHFLKLSHFHYFLGFLQQVTQSLQVSFLWRNKTNVGLSLIWLFSDKFFQDPA